MQDGWYDANNTRYGIHTASGLNGFSKVSIAQNFSGKTVYLSNDIDMNPGWIAPKNANEEVIGNPVSFTTIANNETVANGGTAAKVFYGTFDGRNHTISGLYINSSSAYYGGLFGKCYKSSVVKNFAITNSYMYHKGTNWAGSVMGLCMGGTISNVYSDMVIKANSVQVGGIAGRFEGTISNCWFNGKIYTTKTGNGSWGIGGIVGAVGKSNDGMTLTISNCLYSGEIVTSATSSSTNVGVGGMIGDRRNAITTITLDNCIVSGTIDTATSNGSGAFIGLLSNYATSQYIIDNCYARSDFSKNVANSLLIGIDKGSASTSTTATSSLVSYASLKGAEIYSNSNIDLDYTTWVARTNDTPIPRVFVNWIIPMSETVEK